MSKKVAIMTWYTHHNYGTALQVSALYNIVQKMGYSADVINYLPKAGRKEKNLKVLKTEVKDRIKRLIYKDYRSQDRTDMFLKYLNEKITETVPCRSYVELSDLEENYEAFVCGSDQIWSPLNFDEKYFLPFVSDDNRKIAYAPSIGVNQVDDARIAKRMAAHIGRFTHLSARELRGAEIIEELTGKKAKVVLDPTLLMTSEEWDSFIKSDELLDLSHQDYMICYFLGDYRQYMSYVRKLSQHLKIPYYVIPVKKAEKRSKEAVPFEVGPREFVSLIKNAKYVCTDSFHGTVFAANYQKPFSVFKRFADHDKNNQNSRIFSFLKLINLEERLVDPKETPSKESCILDFSNATRVLSEMRLESYEYLASSLKKATQSSEKKSAEVYVITDMCCGCGACASICPKGAIEIALDKEGFQHYHIDESKCVKCGACKTVCPMHSVKAMELKTALSLYSVKSKQESVLEKSSSGGIGHELANMLHSSGVYVCGCAYDRDANNARHILIEPMHTEDVSPLQGSKYIQSITHDVMKSIVSITKQQKLIFFGTPCQCAAVDNLCKKYKTKDNLYLVDLICHGVPSIHLWNKYLGELNEKYSTGLHPKVAFRSNEGNWDRRELRVEGEHAVHSEKEDKDNFYAFFRRGLCDMNSCAECPYRERSSADLRIGDYWGRRFKNDKGGVSMVIATTERGKELISLLQKNDLADIQEFSLDEYWSIQAPYNYNTSLVREQLIEELIENKRPLSEMRKEYCTYYDVREYLSKIYQDVRHLLKLD